MTAAVTHGAITTSAISADTDAGADSWRIDTMLMRALWTLFASIVGPAWAVQFVALSLPAIVLLLTTGPSFAAEQRSPPAAAIKPCAKDDTGITLPAGFCATVFADNVGHARHLVVAPNGVVYVNTWSGTYYGNDKPPSGGFLVALQDTKGDGQANVKIRFGTGTESGNAGGTGIALYNGALYAETNDRSCVTLYRRERLLRPRNLKPSFPECPLPGTTPCTPSRSTRRVRYMSILARPVIRAKSRTAYSIRPVSIRVRNLKRGPASGATMPTAPASTFLPLSASSPGCETERASRSTPRDEFLRPSMAGTNWGRTGYKKKEYKHAYFKTYFQN